MAMPLLSVCRTEKTTLSTLAIAVALTAVAASRPIDIAGRVPGLLTPGWLYGVSRGAIINSVLPH
jgi:hypothetical protein